MLEYEQNFYSFCMTFQKNFFLFLKVIDYNWTYQKLTFLRLYVSLNIVVVKNIIEITPRIK